MFQLSSHLPKDVTNQTLIINPLNCYKKFDNSPLLYKKSYKLRLFHGKKFTIIELKYNPYPLSFLTFNLSYGNDPIWDHSLYIYIWLHKTYVCAYIKHIYGSIIYVCI